MTWQFAVCSCFFGWQLDCLGFIALVECLSVFSASVNSTALFVILLLGIHMFFPAEAVGGRRNVLV